MRSFPFSFTLFFLLFPVLMNNIFAQSKSEIDWKLSGRLFIDGNIYMRSADTLQNSFGVPDVRLSGKISFRRHWYTKIDIGFANNKVSLKDAYLEYNKYNNFFRAGYMLGFFSLDESNSSNDIVFISGANVTETFYPGRRTGVSFTRALTHHYYSFCAFSGDNLTTTSVIRPGYNFTGRYVWRTGEGNSKFFHIGTGLLYKVPNMNLANNQRSLILKSTGNTCLPSPDLLYINLDRVQSQVQANIELHANNRRWFVQTEYLGMRVKRTSGLTNYFAHGGYLQTGFMIRGGHFAYDKIDALPLMPTGNNSILLSARYNFTQLNDKHTDLFGGSQHDFSLGLNYYLNTFLCAKLNFSTIWLDNNSPIRKSVNQMVQARMQFRF